MMPVHVAGTAVWVRGFPDSAAWLHGTVNPGVTVAPAEWLPAALRRRATPLARMAAEVAARAAVPGQADLARVPLIVGSAYGEIATAVEMMRSFREGDGMPSPMRFHNSVHNSSAAYCSIAAGNRSFSTALAAGPATPAMALLEAAAWLAERGGDVLLVLHDEPPPEPFEPPVPYPPAAVAFHLSAQPMLATRARLARLRRGNAPVAALPGGIGAHPCAGGFAMAEALLSGRVGPVPLGDLEGESWVVDVDEVRVP